MKNNPFEFKKRVKPRQPDDKYGDGKIKMQSVLIRPRKNSSLVQQPVKLDDLSHDLNNINVSPKHAPKQVEEQANFKQRYFIYFDHVIIQFGHEDDTMERSVLQIKYARLKKTYIKDDKTKLYGFILMQKGLSLQFYTEDE